MRMLQQGAPPQSWRSPFLLDPSIPAPSIKTEQIQYGYPASSANNNTNQNNNNNNSNNNSNAGGVSNYHSQLTHLAAANSVGSNNSSAAAAAAAAAMFYPIELGDSNMFGRINVPFNSNGASLASGNLHAQLNNNNNNSGLRQQRQNLSSHAINGKIKVSFYAPF